MLLSPREPSIAMVVSKSPRTNPHEDAEAITFSGSKLTASEVSEETAACLKTRTPAYRSEVARLLCPWGLVRGLLFKRRDSATACRACDFGSLGFKVYVLWDTCDCWGMNVSWGPREKTDPH